MSCYTRHLEDPMRVAGLAFNAAGKREADKRIRIRLDMIEAGCPDVWARLKRLSPEDLRDLLRDPASG